MTSYEYKKILRETQNDLKQYLDYRNSIKVMIEELLNDEDQIDNELTKKIQFNS